MVAGNVLIAASCLSAFLGAFIVVVQGFGALHTQFRFQRLQQRLGGGLHLRVLQTGITCFDPLTRKLLGMPRVQHYCQRLCLAFEQRGLLAQPQGILSVELLFCMVLLIGGALFKRIALGFLAAVAFVYFVGTWADHVQELRAQRMRDALPDALSAMSSCFGAGFTLQQTFSHLEQELRGPLAQLFGRAARALKTGSSPQQALARIRKEGGIAELSFVSVALAVQHQTGGSMQRVLDATRESLKEELELAQSLRVHTAQAKLSARVVVGVTVGLVAAMMLISRDFLQPFFESSAGLALLVLALAMQVIGIVAVRRLLNVELG